MAFLEQRLIEQAHRLGFELAGVAAATPADGLERFHEWLDRGFAGEMGYLHATRDARGDPRSIYAPVRSVLMVGMSYAPGAPVARDESEKTAGARVARYAQGADYHVVIRQKLKELGGWLRQERPGCWGRVVVDTAPLLERDFARRAGLGWFGKNTMLLNPRLGSWFVLGGLLLDIDLEPSATFETSHCGRCTACLDACPTGAFAGPGLLDARKCISYLTIELKSSVPEEHRGELGDWLYGCDVCQEVCPWNRKAPPGQPDLAPRPDLVAIDPVELLGLSDEAFRRRFTGTALFPRPGRPVVLRNAALVLGNVGDDRSLPALRRALDDREPLIREAAAWAIARIEARQGGQR